MTIAAQIVENLLGDEAPLDPKQELTSMAARDPGFGIPTIDSLDEFTRGYLSAAFFTQEDQLKEEAEQLGLDPAEHDFEWDVEALIRAQEDCAKFQEENREAIDSRSDQEAGMDFWYTRNGHGVGFWDGDWEEPWASQLDKASEAFGEVWTYLGDDGKIYFH